MIGIAFVRFSITERKMMRCYDSRARAVSNYITSTLILHFTSWPVGFDVNSC